MAQNYYDELMEKIEQLISQNQLDEANKLIEIELALPYVPNVYEQKLIAIQKQIKPESKTTKAIFSKDEIIDIFLKHHHEHSNQFLLEVAQMIINYQWLDYIQEIQQIFNQNQLANNLKATIYNCLSLQNLNYDFQIDQVQLNPFINKTLFETDFAVANFEELENINLSEPNLISIAKQLLIIYLLNLFPKSMNLELKMIANDLIVIARLMLGELEIEQLNENQIHIYQIIKLN